MTRQAWRDSIDDLVTFLDDRLDEDHLTVEKQVVVYARQLMALPEQPNREAIDAEALAMLHALAVPYSGHPAFRQAWTHRP